MGDIKIDNAKSGDTHTITVGDDTDNAPQIGDVPRSGYLRHDDLGTVQLPVNQGTVITQGTHTGGNYNRQWKLVPADDGDNRDDGVPSDVRQTRDETINVVEHRGLIVPLALRQESMTEDENYYVFRGLASRTDTPYTMYDFFGSYDEVIQKGAFANTLRQDPKVVLNVNHAGLALASTKANPPTLRLWEDDEGLQVEARIRKGIDRVEEIVAGIRDGNIDEMSFAFRVQRQKWSPDYMQRDILEVNLHRGDVSIVTYGANPNTATAIRADDDPDGRGDDTSVTIRTDDRTDDQLRADGDATTEPAGDGGDGPVDPPDTTTDTADGDDRSDDGDGGGDDAGASDAGDDSSGDAGDGDGDAGDTEYLLAKQAEDQHRIELMAAQAERAMARFGDDPE